jgi:exodeoxyribonuclease VII small subunit
MKAQAGTKRMADTGSERFEDLLARLEQLVKALECEELDLEQSLQAYEEGVRIARACHQKLDEAERRVEVLRRLPNGEVVSEPYRPVKEP